MIQKIFLLMFLIFAVPLHAQIGNDYFTLRIDNIPGIHSWVYATDPNETGHLTYKSDSSDYLFIDSKGTKFDYLRLYEVSKDTLHYFSDNTDLFLVFAQKPFNVKSINLSSVLPYQGSFGTEKYSFSIENVILNETTNELTGQLIGNNIQNHNLKVNESTYTQDGSSETWSDYYRNTGLTDSSIISFSISKKDIIQSKVNPNSPDLALEISPNPTSGIITVHDAPGNLLSVGVLNVLGQMMLEIPHPNTPEFTLDLSKLPAGTYFARIVTANSVEVQKIIKE